MRTLVPSALHFVLKKSVVHSKCEQLVSRPFLLMLTVVPKSTLKSLKVLKVLVPFLKGRFDWFDSVTENKKKFETF